MAHTIQILTSGTALVNRIILLVRTPRFLSGSRLNWLFFQPVPRCNAPLQCPRPQPTITNFFQPARCLHYRLTAGSLPAHCLQSRTFSSRLVKRWNFNLPFFDIVKMDRYMAHLLNNPLIFTHFRRISRLFSQSTFSHVPKPLVHKAP